MQFFYHEDAGVLNLSLPKSEQKHFKARRIKHQASFLFRNLKDDCLYTYTLACPKTFEFRLTKVEKDSVKDQGKAIKLALAMIDPKDIEQVLPFINELGLSSLILVKTHFSQGNFKLDEKRVLNILINSCKQSGRTRLLKLESFDSLDSFLQSYPLSCALDFNADLASFDENELYFIGPEAGFSKEELQLFKKKSSLKLSNILKSKTALTALCAKLCL